MKTTIRNILLGASLMVLTNPSFATRHEELTDDTPCRVASLQQQVAFALLGQGIPDQVSHDFLKNRINTFSYHFLLTLLHHHKINEVTNRSTNGYERYTLLISFINKDKDTWDENKKSIILLLDLLNDIKPDCIPRIPSSNKFHYVGRSYIFKSILDVNIDEIPETALACSLLTRGIPNSQESLDIVKIITQEPANYRLPFAQMCEPLIEDYTNEFSRKEIINTVLTLPKESREKFAQNCLRLDTRKTKADLYYYKETIKCLARIPENERDLFIEQSKVISKHADSLMQHRNIKIMSTLSPQDRAEYANNLNSFSQLVEQKDIGFFLETLRELPKKNAHHFVKTAQHLSPLIPNYNVFLSVLRSLKEIYKDNRIKAIENIRAFYADPIHTNVNGEILLPLTQYPLSHWSQIATLAKSLLDTSYVGGGDHKLIIDALYTVAPDQRGDIIRSGAPLFNATKSKYARAEIIFILATLPSHTRSRFAHEGVSFMYNIQEERQCINILRKEAQELCKKAQESYKKWQEITASTSASPQSSSSHEPSAKRSRRS